MAIFLPMYKGNLVTAVSSPPCLSKATPYLPPHVGAMLGLSNKVLSRKSPKLKCTIYKPTSLLRMFGSAKGTCMTRSQGWEKKNHLFPSPRGSWVDDSLVQ